MSESTREPLIQQMQGRSFPTCPTVVQLDGIWVSMQSQGEKIKPDTRKRKRKQRSGKKIVILLALGFWDDGTREVLDWQIASSARAYPVESVVESSLAAQRAARKGTTDDRARWLVEGEKKPLPWCMARPFWINDVFSTNRRMLETKRAVNSKERRSVKRETR